MSTPVRETTTQELKEDPTSGLQSCLWTPSPHLQQSSQASLLDTFHLGWDSEGSPRVWASCTRHNPSAHPRLKHLDCGLLCFLLEGGEGKKGGEVDIPIVKHWDINSEAIWVREPDERKREGTVLLQLTRCFGPAGKQSNDITSHEFLLADYLFANTFSGQDKAGWQMESILWPQMTQKYVGKNTAMFKNNCIYFGRVAVMLNSIEGFRTQMSRATIC